MKVEKNYIKVDIGTTGFHRRCNDVQNEVVRLIYDAFTDHGSDVQWLLRCLLDFDSEGVDVELVSVSLKDKVVVLQPSFLMSDDPEEHAVEIDRNELIYLAHKWQELIDNKVAPIYIYYKDGKYGVADILPEGVE